MPIKPLIPPRPPVFWVATPLSVPAVVPIFGSTSSIGPVETCLNEQAFTMKTVRTKPINRVICSETPRTENPSPARK